MNRVDEIILFKPLRESEIEQIVDLLVRDIEKRLADRRITLHLTPRAKKYIVEKGYDPVYGARPLKRFLQRELETRLARSLIQNEVADDSRVTVDYLEDKLVIGVKDSKPVKKS